jgi:hypothetical protein
MPSKLLWLSSGNSIGGNSMQQSRVIDSSPLGLVIRAAFPFSKETILK